MTLVAPELLAIMQCPSCAGSLHEEPGIEANQPPSLVCDACGLAYPVTDGIPSMIVEEATPTEPRR